MVPLFNYLINTFMLSYDLKNKGDKLTMNDTNSCYILFILPTVFTGNRYKERYSSIYILLNLFIISQ